VRLKVPGITAKLGSSLDTHDQRLLLKPAGMPSSWPNAEHASERRTSPSSIVA
jgi:hypothetical protein